MRSNGNCRADYQNTRVFPSAADLQFNRCSLGMWRKGVTAENRTETVCDFSRATRYAIINFRPDCPDQVRSLTSRTHQQGADKQEKGQPMLPQSWQMSLFITRDQVQRAQMVMPYNIGVRQRANLHFTD